MQTYFHLSSPTKTITCRSNIRSPIQCFESVTFAFVEANNWTNEKVPIFSGSFCYAGWYRVTVVIRHYHYFSDVIMSAMASQITGVPMVCSTVCSCADQRKHQSYALLAFVRGIHRWPVNSPRTGPVTRKMFPFDDVIMIMMAQTART